MLGCFIAALLLFIGAAVQHWRNPTWAYNSTLIAWGFVFLTAALGWVPIKEAFTK